MRHILLSFRCLPRSIMLLVSGLSGWPAQQGTNSGTVRIHFLFKVLHSVTADSPMADSLSLRQFTECAADLGSDQVLRWRKCVRLHYRFEVTVRCPTLRIHL
jgi:hypothetical protein